MSLTCPKPVPSPLGRALVFWVQATLCCPLLLSACLNLFVFQYEVSDDSFFQNMLNFYNFSSRVMADQLRKTPNKDQ